MFVYAPLIEQCRFEQILLFFSTIDSYKTKLSLNMFLLTENDSRTKNYLPLMNSSSPFSHSPSKFLHSNFSSCPVDIERNGLVLDKQRHILVIGAMSFIGARVTMYLHERGHHVLAVEDLINVNNDDMKWYRWTQLMKNRIPVQIVMLSRKDKLMSLLSHHSPQAVIYVPTRVDWVERNDDTVNSVLRNFVSLLSNLKSRPQVVLVSYWRTLLENGWLTSYETILSIMYSRSSSSIVRVSSVYGPWEDLTEGRMKWYINDVCSIIEKSLTSKQFIWDMDRCTSFTDGKHFLLPNNNSPTDKETDKWLGEYNKYISRRTRNVTLGAYLVSVSYVSQYGIFPVSNSFRYLFNWFTTATSHRLDIVLFHDTMSQSFQQKLKELHHNTETIHVKPVSLMIANDQRFYFIYDYLLRNDDINLAIATDIRDVEFLRDPSETMSLIGDYIFTGLDVPFYTDVGGHGQANAYKRCYPHLPRNEVFQSYGLFNVGVIGGTRSAVLTFLIHFLLNLEVSTHVGNSCCDMPSIELLMHTVFFDSGFVGYPFNSAFFTQTPGPRGLTIRHKPM